LIANTAAIAIAGTNRTRAFSSVYEMLLSLSGRCRVTLVAEKKYDVKSLARHDAGAIVAWC